MTYGHISSIVELAIQVDLSEFYCPTEAASGLKIIKLRLETIHHFSQSDP
jgi:hypothetical protein